MLVWVAVLSLLSVALSQANNAHLCRELNEFDHALSFEIPQFLAIATKINHFLGIPNDSQIFENQEFSPSAASWLTNLLTVPIPYGELGQVLATFSVQVVKRIPRHYVTSDLLNALISNKYFYDYADHFSSIISGLPIDANFHLNLDPILQDCFGLYCEDFNAAHRLVRIVQDSPLFLSAVADHAAGTLTPASWARIFAGVIGDAASIDYYVTDADQCPTLARAVCVILALQNDVKLLFLVLWYRMPPTQRCVQLLHFFDEGEISLEEIFEYTASPKELLQGWYAHVLPAWYEAEAAGGATRQHQDVTKAWFLYVAAQLEMYITDSMATFIASHAEWLLETEDVPLPDYFSELPDQIRPLCYALKAASELHSHFLRHNAVEMAAALLPLFLDAMAQFDQGRFPRLFHDISGCITKLSLDFDLTITFHLLWHKSLPEVMLFPLDKSHVAFCSLIQCLLEGGKIASTDLLPYFQTHSLFFLFEQYMLPSWSVVAADFRLGNEMAASHHTDLVHETFQFLCKQQRISCDDLANTFGDKVPFALITLLSRRLNRGAREDQVSELPIAIQVVDRLRKSLPAISSDLERENIIEMMVFVIENSPEHLQDGFLHLYLNFSDFGSPIGFRHASDLALLSLLRNPELIPARLRIWFITRLYVAATDARRGLLYAVADSAGRQLIRQACSKSTYLASPSVYTAILIPSLDLVHDEGVSSDWECSICQEREPIKCLELICRHRFHPDCIQPWSQTSALCPLCRTPHRIEDVIAGQLSLRSTSLSTNRFSETIPSMEMLFTL